MLYSIRNNIRCPTRLQQGIYRHLLLNFKAIEVFTQAEQLGKEIQSENLIRSALVYKGNALINAKRVQLFT